MTRATNLRLIRNATGRLADLPARARVVASPLARTPRRNRERGSLLMEFALVAPVLLMLLMGTITLGLSYNRSISLSNAARESSRYAATLPVGDDISGWLNTVADVARDSAAGDLVASAPGQTLCVAYVFPDGSETHDRTVALLEDAGSRTVVVGRTCFDDGRPAGERRVQVYMSRESDLSTAVYTNTNTLVAESVARFERA